MNCIVSEHEISGLYEFARGLLHRTRRAGVRTLKLVIVHSMQRNFSDILRCVAVCEIYYYESSWRL